MFGQQGLLVKNFDLNDAKRGEITHSHIFKIAGDELLLDSLDLSNGSLREGCGKLGQIQLLHRCVALRALNLSSNALWLDPWIDLTMDANEVFSQEASLLNALNEKSRNTLCELDLFATSTLYPKDMVALATAFKNLRRLSIGKVQFDEESLGTGYQDDFIPFFSVLPKQMQALDLSNCRFVSITHMEIIIERCKNLQGKVFREASKIQHFILILEIM